MVAAAFMAVRLVPVLCTYFLGGRLRPEEWNPLMRGLRAVYRPLLVNALRHRLVTVSVAAALFAGAALAATRVDMKEERETVVAETAAESAGGGEEKPASGAATAVTETRVGRTQTTLARRRVNRTALVAPAAFAAVAAVA